MSDSIKDYVHTIEWIEDSLNILNGFDNYLYLMQKHSMVYRETLEDLINNFKGDDDDDV